MTNDLSAVWEGSFSIGGVELRCYVLSNGERVFDADDFAALFMAMSGFENLAREDVDTLVQWVSGRGIGEAKTATNPGKGSNE